MAPEFDMKKVTTPLLLHMLGGCDSQDCFFCAASSRSVDSKKRSTSDFQTN